jgi:hypothetical protein
MPRILLPGDLNWTAQSTVLSMGSNCFLLLQSENCLLPLCAELQVASASCSKLTVGAWERETWATYLSAKCVWTVLNYPSTSLAQPSVRLAGHLNRVPCVTRSRRRAFLFVCFARGDKTTQKSASVRANAQSLDSSCYTRARLVDANLSTPLLTYAKCSRTGSKAFWRIKRQHIGKNIMIRHISE